MTAQIELRSMKRTFTLTVDDETLRAVVFFLEATLTKEMYADYNVMGESERSFEWSRAWEALKVFQTALNGR